MIHKSKYDANPKNRDAEAFSSPIKALVESSNTLVRATTWSWLLYKIEWKIGIELFYRLICFSEKGGQVCSENEQNKRVVVSTVGSKLVGGIVMGKIC